MKQSTYQVLIYWSEEDQAYIAEVPELPDCIADGETRQEALENTEQIIEEWIETAKELGRTVPEPGGRIMTIPEAADRLGLSVAMVRRYCKEGQLPAKKIGRDWTVRQGDVERFAASPRKPGRKSAHF